MAMSLLLQSGLTEASHGFRQAIGGVEARLPVRFRLTVETGFENVDGGQSLALQKLEEGAAGGRDVADLVFDLENVDCRDGVTATRQGECL